jgi:hypothetical protein
MIAKARIGSMRELAEQLSARLGPSWARVVGWLRANNSLRNIQRRIEAGDYDNALQGIEDAARRFATDVTSAQQIASQHAATWLDGQVGSSQLISYDATNHNAVRAVQRTRTDLIVSVSNEQRETVRQAISFGLEHGNNPKVIAEDIRLSIGLAPSQQEIVYNFRRQLEGGEFRAALRRNLVDGQSARTLRRMQRDGGALSQEQVDRMVNRYTDNWVTYRSETIARTEALRSAHTGHHVMYQQAVEDGAIEAGELVQRWNHKNIGAHARPEHRVMHGQERPFGEPFVSGSGALLKYPCDPDADASETINCRCVVSTRYIRNRSRSGQRAA